jgi:hypothetical protein
MPSTFVLLFLAGFADDTPASLPTLVFCCMLLLVHFSRCSPALPCSLCEVASQPYHELYHSDYHAEEGCKKGKKLSVPLTAPPGAL